ncbi:tyrosine-type recombinase/integrase [Mammaliicoccus lentus]|uniref:tyrosine-type recombinase/integrase n=1 Tax=Mammaliicoccus lentus TaxID=42858 RepID=UPI001072687F|nr:site-specific integrase [Mammaliicoccus lentus]MBF0749831.1 site-specific integrase [Mammaliicoccus lentus]TFU57279.1 site-specific integrase [Mammaliicoccus lentus]
MWIEKFKNKDGKTQYRYYEKFKDTYTNKWRRTSIVLNTNNKQSKREAIKLLDEKISQTLSKDSMKIEDVTFHEVINQWFSLHIKTSGIKATTLKNHETLVKHLKESIDNNVLLSKIDFPFLQTLILDVFDNYKSNVAIRISNILNNILKHADSYYKTNLKIIYNDVTIPKKAKTIDEIEKEEQKQYNYLEMNTVLKIRDNILNSKYNNKRLKFLVASIIELQALTGLRVGEVQALQVSNIDLSNKTITVNGTIHWIKYEEGYGYKDTAKTKGSHRVITINKRSCEILKSVILDHKKMSQWHDKYNDRGFIFTTAGGNPLYSHKINRLLAIAAKNLELDIHITTHTFRHTHISLLVEMNISLKAIMKRVGHTDEKTTIKVYTHVTEKMDKLLVEKLDSIPS